MFEIDTIEKSNKTVLITGCAGFIGEILIKQVTKKGYNVLGIDILEPEDVLEQKNFSYIKLDVLSSELKKLNFTGSIDWLIHLGGISSSRLCAEKPELAYNVNVQGSINLLALLKQKNQRPHVVLASSSEVYGIRDPLKHLTEKNGLFGNTPYAYSKRAAESVWRYFSELYGFNWTIFRFSNTYGRKNAQQGYVVEYLLDCAINNTEPDIRTPEVVNQFLFVKDHIESYLKLLEKPIQGIYNVAGKDFLRIDDLYKKIKDLVAKEISDKAETKQGERGIVLETQKIESDLNWKPKYSLEDGITVMLNQWRETM